MNAQETADLPTTDSRGRPVIGYDNGTSRPSSRPIDADAGAGIETNDQGGGAHGASESGDPLPSDTEQVVDLAGIRHSELLTDSLYLALPKTTRYSTAMVLSALAVRRAEQDAKWGGPANDHLHSIGDWICLINSHTSAISATGPSNFDGLIKELTDLAASAAAAIESLTHQLEVIDAPAKTATAGINAPMSEVGYQRADQSGGDSTGLVDADTNLAGSGPDDANENDDADEDDAEVTAGAATDADAVASLGDRAEG